MIALFSFVAAVLAVGIHHETLVVASWLTRFASPKRFRPGLVVLLALLAHLLEVALFAGAWWWLIDAGAATLSIPNPDALDLLYFSGSVYTSLGFGDIVPLGPSRLLSVVEAVTGLVLIAWTASFTYLEMQRNWEDRG